MPKPDKGAHKKGKGDRKPFSKGQGDRKPFSKGKGDRKPFKDGQKPRKREIVFDPEARKAHLRGFSERKRQRRAFGLAMQRVKDREAKIEQRAQEKKDNLERIETAENQKAELLTEALLSAGVIEEDTNEYQSDDSDDEAENARKGQAVIDSKKYDDKQTEAHWGGQVTVTTSMVDLGDDSDDDDDSIAQEKKQKKSIDIEQKFAGKVDKYLHQLKSSMPSRKKGGKPAKRKGKNGASDMKGMGGSATLKLAQKVLGKAKSKQPVRGSGTNRKKKGGRPPSR